MGLAHRPVAWPAPRPVGEAKLSGGEDRGRDRRPPASTSTRVSPGSFVLVAGPELDRAHVGTTGELLDAGVVVPGEDERLVLGRERADRLHRGVPLLALPHDR